MMYEFLRSDFVADALVNSFEQGRFPDDGQALLFDRRFIIDGLRSRLSPTFVPMLMRVVNTQSGPSAGLAAALLRPHIQVPEVHTAFQKRWKSASPYLRNRLMWQLLSDRNLSTYWQETFLHFLITDWEVCRDFHYAFYGPREQALDRFLHRLGDSSLADGEKWIYLCCALGEVRDRNAADALSSLGSTMGAFAQRLTKALVERIFASAETAPREHRSPDLEQDRPGLGLAADAVAQFLRLGHVPTEQEADWLNRLPIVDLLRSRMTEDDLRWVWPAIENESGERLGLHLSLLRKFTTRQGVQQRLQQRWQTADAFGRAHLIWRILDDPQLPEEWHQKLFRFVLSDWEQFQKVSLKFLGTPSTVVQQTLKRIGDTSFPDSKKWAYLCRVPTVSDDSEAAKALVSLGLLMRDAFTKEVAAELLNRFFAKPKSAAAA